MFGRSSSDRTTQDDQRRRDFLQRSDPPGTREAVAVPVASQTDRPSVPAPRSNADDSVVASEDRIEGKLKTRRGLRIHGVVDGHIESAAAVHIDEGAKVTADITAEEVIIAGQYSGKLICRQRLEVLPTGHVNGNIETVKLMLHEGGFVDGELHMQKPQPAMAGADADQSRPGGDQSRPGDSLRASGNIRSTVEPSIRQTAAASAGTAQPGGNSKETPGS